MTPNVSPSCSDAGAVNRDTQQIPVIQLHNSAVEDVCGAERTQQAEIAATLLRNDYLFLFEG